MTLPSAAFHAARGSLLTLDFSFRRDWGNALQFSFMKSVQAWEHRVLAIAAGEFFKVAIRRHPSAVCWSWALEWNQSVRVVGLMGDRADMEAHAALLSYPSASATTYAGSQFRIRADQALDERSDTLFERPVSEQLTR